MAVNQNRTLIQKYGIPLDHIDYNYVNQCEDPKELKRIIQILESGEEGHFPKLLMKTEDRLRQIKPDASILNRKLSFAQKSSDLTKNENFNEVFNDIAKWIQIANNQETNVQSKKQNSTNSMNGYEEQPNRKSVDLTSIFNSEKPERKLSTNLSHGSFSFSNPYNYGVAEVTTHDRHRYRENNDKLEENRKRFLKLRESKQTLDGFNETPENDSKNKALSMNGLNVYDEQPVRRSINLTTMFNSGKPEQELSMNRMSNVPNESLDVSYSKWDKYDPDVELMKMDNKEKIEKLKSCDNKRNTNSNCLSVKNDTSGHQDRIKSMINYVATVSKSGTVKPQDLAIREKMLGNECFNSNDYEDAICYYNTSIKIHPTLEARNNRAMSYIKLKRFEEALDDLREVIENDPRNVKAHYRRGSCFKAISMFCLALRSFETTLKYDCNNLKALYFVKELKNLILNITPKKLIRVREITRHYDQTVWDIEEPFHVTYVELTELNKERVEYLYEADSFGCLTECVCQLCPWHEWQQRKKKWSRHKIYKNEEPRKRWQFLTSDIIPLLISKSLEPEVQKPKRLNVTEINSSKMNGHHTNSRKINHNGVNKIAKSPCEHCDNDGLSIKPVSNVQEFLLNWKTASKKKCYELYHKLLRSIQPKDLPKVISTNLDEEIMSTFLETLNRKFDPDSELDLIAEYLIAMTKVNRFNLIVKMLDNKVKEDFQPLMKRVHQHTNNSLFLSLL